MNKAGDRENREIIDEKWDRQKFTAKQHDNEDNRQGNIGIILVTRICQAFGDFSVAKP